MSKTYTKSVLFISLLVVGITGFSLVATKTAEALSGSEFRANHIIDDEIFYNGSTMTSSQIQSFLNAKMPTCDINGEVGPFLDRNGNGWDTRADYGRANGAPPPYTCLKDYVQSYDARSDSGLCSYIAPGSNRTAAQIIDTVARACNINQKALIVILQKEQSLITDDWPWPIQYDKAMGYYCPDDTENPGWCHPNFAGFFNQVYGAAKGFNDYKMFPEDWNHAKGRTSFVSYQVDNPDTVQNENTLCGGTNLTMQTAATAGLYNYTPYQPNKAALDNLYETGDSCSAYGNRNFWRMFNDWFGPTIQPKISAVRIDGNTDKSGERALVGFKLDKKPTNSVKISLAVSSPSNARLTSQTSVTISPQTWDRPELNTIPVIGLNNNDLTGTYQYSLVPTKVESSDTRFNGIGPSQIGNIDIVQLDTKSPPNVYRLYSESLKQHVLTANRIDRNALIADGWRDEGVRFSYCYTGDRTVMRLRQGDIRRLVVDNTSVHRSATAAGFTHEKTDFAVSSQGNAPVYWRYNNATGNSLYTTVSTEATTGDWVDKGIAFYTCRADNKSVYRLYRSSTQSHLFTASSTERDLAMHDNGFRYEGLGYYTCESGDQNFYRLFRKSNGNHIYTTSSSERDQAINEHGFRYEGVKFKLCSVDSRNVYRLYNPATTNHFYTTSKSESNSATRSGFRYEGVKFQAR
jgi:hypothetical protein